MQESIYSLESFVNFISVGLAEKSVKSYEKVVEHFFEFMEARGKSPADLERVDLTDYILALKNRGLSPSFINTNFAGIKKYYRYLVKNKAFEKILFLDIFDDVDRPKIVFNNQKVYEKQDAEKILKIYEKNVDNLIGFGNYVFLLIMTTTGGRCGETANLKVGDIDFGTNHITFFNTKNRKPRAVKMCDYLAETLAKYLQMRANCLKDGSLRLPIPR